MKVLIYGGGAVGLGIASCLIKSKADVHIIAREDTVSRLLKFGLLRTGIFGSFHAKPSVFNAYPLLDNTPKNTVDYILVCTKSFDSMEAAKDISEHKFLFGNKTKIVLFQNGWGNAEKFLNFFDKDLIYNARVITGFSRTKSNEVTITVHADSIHLGSLFKSDISPLGDLCKLISQGDIPCELTDKIEEDLWAKMLYNCALNPLGAILKVPYGELAEHEFTRFIMNGIIHEIFDVIKTAGYKTHWNDANDFLDVFYNKLVPDTAGHKPSTLQDITAKRKTEIEALNGAVVNLAKIFNKNVPYNLTVYNMVKFIESGTA